MGEEELHMFGDERRYSAAVTELASRQKSGHGVPAYLRWVNRGLGRRMAAAAYVLRMTPNQVTLFSTIFSFAAIALIAWAPPSITVCIAAVALLLLGYALDSADGQLARLLEVGGPAGEWLDHVVDALRLPAFHMGVAVGLYLRPEAQTWTVGLAAGFALLSSTWFIGQLLAEKLGPSHVEAPGGNAPAWVSFLKQPYDVSSTFFTILFLPWLPAFLAVYGALFVVTFAVACISLWRKHTWLARVSMARSQREA